MSRIELKDMEFFARHGCFEQERRIGNNFMVDFWYESDFSTAAHSDDINDAINYQDVYTIIKEQMNIPSSLLENVAFRILSAVRKKFPAIRDAGVSIDKINPPLGGKLYSSRVVMDLSDLLRNGGNDIA
ncbi:MAG: dihydroneopterin aldolase [Bacteroidales bacterium]|jgi:dihydroneopterin aldolase|nr:dihydroneopterin aldolase [Bacteroidales bacterium]